MQKHEFLKEVQKRMGEDAMPLSKVDETVSAVFNAIADAMQKRETVSIRGFGTFRAHLRNERVARNPQTKEDVIVPAKYVPKFSPSTLLAKQVAE